ncbi:MAG: PilZ domain-containing protein [Desulfobulbaceae bacterium]|uniref:PilZ domain-containing protein n=1 Tax=Candidatus Desulfobia pelagia TaxID=2841692 RepID=A0A8J6NBN0_9BACT|nr:PilZ domain-containing protein [Candidatus Desulfobia pelagia]
MGRKERRRDVRVAFKTTVSLHFKDGEYAHCETKDLSLKGIFIPGIGDRDPGEKCHITVLLSGVSSELKIRMKGEVVRKTDEGIGVYFNEIDVDSFFHLKNIVYYNVDDPDQIAALFLERVPEGSYVDD